jgi:hypothetical protein
MTMRFSVHLPDDVVEHVKTAAAEAEISIDDLLVGLVTQGINQRRGLTVIRERAARANVDAALAILDQVPDVDPDPRDQILP